LIYWRSISKFYRNWNAPHYSAFSDLDRNTYHSAVGIFHVGVNFFTNQLYDLASIACTIGAHECADSLEEKLSFQAACSQWQIEHIHAFDSLVANCLCIDSNHPIYQTCRTYTTAGLEIGSLAIGGYGLAKGGIALAKMGRHSLSEGVKIAGKVVHQELLTTTSLNRFNQATCNLTFEGKNNIRILRGWAKSKGWEKASNTSKGGPEVWGKNINGRFEWNLKIKPEASFRPGLENGSNIPRFDARISKGRYINPFSGEIGETNIGTHLPLEYSYY
jgi:hypothetical protein